MQLWILRPVETRPQGDDPWEPWYDCAFGFVVRAETETSARALVEEQAGDEKHNGFDLEKRKYNLTRAWLDGKYSTCVPLIAEGSEEVIMQDFHAA